MLNDTPPDRCCWIDDRTGVPCKEARRLAEAGDDDAYQEHVIACAGPHPPAETPPLAPLSEEARADRLVQLRILGAARKRQTP